MMGRSIIFCEGETDAILLSYYLCHLRGLKYMKKEMTQLDSTEQTNWYGDGKEKNVAITWVGGHDFRAAMKEVVRINGLAQKKDRFDCMAVLADHDDEKSVQMMKELLDQLRILAHDSVENYEQCEYCPQWEIVHFTNQSNVSYQLRYFGALIPWDREGALETFILQQLCNAPDENTRKANQNVIDEIDKLISNIKSFKTQYIMEP